MNSRPLPGDSPRPAPSQAFSNLLLMIMRRIKDTSAASLHLFVKEAIEPGGIVQTDGWEAYAGVARYGYCHEVTVRTATASGLLRRVHRVVGLLKRWLLGTHRGAVSPAHLDYYLDEFTFRSNRRRCRHRGKLFFRLVQQAVAVEPTPYARMIKHARGREPRDHKIWEEPESSGYPFESFPPDCHEP